jgi:hypothetical protein
MLRPLLPIVVLVAALGAAALAADTGKHAEALAAWDTVAKSSDAKAALAYANQLDDMDDAERDVAAFERAVELLGPKAGKELVDALDSLADAQAWHGQYDAARATAAKALEAAGGDAAAKAHALSIAGNVELAAGAYKAARTKFDAAASAAGSDATEAARAATGIGNVLDRLNDYAAAKTQLVKAAKATGKSATTRVARSQTCRRMRETRRVASRPFAIWSPSPGKRRSRRSTRRTRRSTTPRPWPTPASSPKRRRPSTAPVTDLDALVGADSPAAASARIARAAANTDRGDYASAAKDFAAGLAVLPGVEGSTPGFRRRCSAVLGLCIGCDVAPRSRGGAGGCTRRRHG